MKLPRIDVTTSKALWPLITCNVLGLAFNTYCLRESYVLRFQPSAMVRKCAAKTICIASAELVDASFYVRVSQSLELGSWTGMG